MEGDFSRNLAELRSALEPRPRAARRTYELVDLFVDVAKDLRVLREAAKFDTSLKRVARSLASVLAHPRTGLSIRQLSRSLETSRHEARAARHHFCTPYTLTARTLTNLVLVAKAFVHFLYSSLP